MLDNLFKNTEKQKDKKEIFAEAREIYDDACMIIKNFCEDYEEDDADEKDMLCRFDYVLQCILMKTAISDGRFFDEERKFIKRIVRHGDILDYLREETKYDLSWEDIDGYDLKKMEKLIVDFETILADDAADDFVDPFVFSAKSRSGRVDAEKSFADIKERILLISDKLMEIDGFVVKEEEISAREGINNLLTRNWDHSFGVYSGIDLAQNNKKGIKEKYVANMMYKEGEFNEIELEEIDCLESPLDYDEEDDYRVSSSEDKENFLSTVLYIEIYKGGRFVSSGSGFLISNDGYALTCNHVVEGAEEIYVKTGKMIDGEDLFRVEAVCCRPQQDMAIIKLEAGCYNYLAIDVDRHAPQMGEEIEVYGYPMGDKIADDPSKVNCSLTKGYVSSVQTYQKQMKIFLDVMARHGNSGGPVLSLKTGRVIGMLHGAKMGEGNDEINYTIPIRYIRSAFKNRNSNAKE